MKSEEAFESWAPDDAVWSPWAKPVLFTQEVSAAPAQVASAQVASAQVATATTSSPSLASGAAAAPPAAAAPQALAVTRVTDVGWAPDATRHTAIVLDLPGTSAVEVGLLLLDKGYRPVPLFNSSLGPQPVVAIEPLCTALFGACERIAHARLAPDAPPAFLLDAARRGEPSPAPGRFDNRWLVFPQDFPSANFLLAQGIETVLLVMPRDSRVAEDLAHVLLRWKEGGLALVRQDVEGGTARPLEVARPPRFRAVWYRALVVLGLRRNSSGGFGSIVPTPSSGGHGFS